MKHSFSALGVSAAVEQALAALGFAEPFFIQSLVLPDAIAGRDILAKSPTGSGKTLAFGIPIVERLDRDSARPEALVLVPTRELAIQVAEEVELVRVGEGPPGRSRLRRHARRLAGEAAQGRAHRRRDAGPSPGSDRAQARLARRHPHPRPRRGRPDARHGLPPAGREDPPQRPEGAADHALLGDARRRGRRARRQLHRGSRALRGAARDLERRRRHPARLRVGDTGRQGRHARRAARRRRGALARLRAHEARRRPPRAEACAARRRRRRDARRHGPVAARARARAVPLGSRPPP